MFNTFRGIILVAPHGSYIAQGKKKVVVKSKPFKSILNKRLLLLERKMALGIIKLIKFRIGDLRYFDKLRKRHMITIKERKTWWRGKRVLYFYDVVLIRLFKAPIKIKYSTGPQVFIRPENITVVKKVKGRK